MADERQPDPQGAVELLKQYFGPLLAGLLTLRIVAFYVLAGLFIPQASDITFPEGALVARAMDVARGETPYHDWREWPHAFAPYPPLAYYPVGWLAGLAGPELTPHDVYMIGRACSFAMLIGIFVVLYLLGRRLGLSPAWSLSGVALLAEFRPLLEYCASYRPDAPKTFFALLALLIISRERGRPRPLRLPASTAVSKSQWDFSLGMRNAEYKKRFRFFCWLFAALACLLLSAWFKPTAWGIGVIVLYAIVRRLGPKRGVLALCAFLAAGIIPLLYLNHRWHGLLLLNIVDSLRNGFSLEGLQRAAILPHLGPALVAVVGCGCALLGLRRRGPAGQRLILAAAPLSVAASLFQMLKAGSDVNYFMDSYPLAALAATWGVARLWRGGWRLPESARAAALGCALTLPLLSAALDLTALRGDFQRVMLFWRPPVIERIVRSIPGPVLSTNPFLALTHPESPGILDYYQYSILCRRGALDPEPLLSRVRAGAFNAIIISDPVRHLSETRSADRSELYCRDFLPTLDHFYRRERQVGIYAIYTPLPRVQRAGL